MALAYGPGTRPGDQRVLYDFIERGISKRKIQLLDKGESIRTYCYVSDAIEMFFNILSKGTQPVYNVGGKSKVSIKELAEKIGLILNVPVYLGQTNTTLEGSPVSVELDMGLVENEFGKKRYRDLDSGLVRTIQWFKGKNNLKQ